MRQNEMSAEDVKLRLALENMRYGACTPEDLAFLRTRIAGFRPEDPKLNVADVRNVSIITARNSQKDELNHLGGQRFARDTNQTLEHFYSVDRISSKAVDKLKWRNSPQSELKTLNSKTRRQLWEAMPSMTTDFVPGKLSICIGMPVMLRVNDATELCITKGQEAVVVGWDSGIGPSGQNILETLFVRLVNPPREVNIDGLPVNVVPIPRTVTHVTCLLPDDTVLSVLRDQVVMLLNFGMTDYTAQGKSRLKNVVELTYCKDHRAYYVALSRGTTARGTIILQNFDEKKITSGMSGYLRQELRELETLDEITRLRFEGKIPSTVTGIYRRRLIRSYYAWKTDHRDPVHYHPSIRWRPELGPRIPEVTTYSSWNPSIVATKKRKNAVVSEKGLDDTAKGGPTKKTKTTVSLGAVSTLPRVLQPFGFIWDSSNYSCAYDALFTIIGNVWNTDPHRWQTILPAISESLGIFCNNLRLALDGSQTLENCRDSVRAHLHSISPDDFPYGERATSVDRIAAVAFPLRTHGTGTQSCLTCGTQDVDVYGVFQDFMSAGLGRSEVRPNGVPLSVWLDTNFRKGQRGCQLCTGIARRNSMRMEYVLDSVPKLMIVFLDHNNITFDQKLLFKVGGQEEYLQLRGIIYAGFGHFTCRVVQPDGTVWFHDGMTTRRQCIREFRYEDADKLAMHTCKDRRAVAVVYAMV
jgi:hypothetical protein